MLQDPLVWDWSISYEQYLKQSVIDLRGLKSVSSADHLVITKTSSNSANLCLLDVKKSSTKRKLPVTHWTICRYNGSNFYSIGDKILKGPDQSGRFVEFLLKGYSDSFDWLLFHPEWL